MACSFLISDADILVEFFFGGMAGEQHNIEDIHAGLVFVRAETSACGVGFYEVIFGNHFFAEFAPFGVLTFDRLTEAEIFSNLLEVVV